MFGQMKIKSSLLFLLPLVAIVLSGVSSSYLCAGDRNWVSDYDQEYGGFYSSPFAHHRAEGVFAQLKDVRKMNLREVGEDGMKLAFLNVLAHTPTKIANKIVEKSIIEPVLSVVAAVNTFLTTCVRKVHLGPSVMSEESLSALISDMRTFVGPLVDAQSAGLGREKRLRAVMGGVGVKGAADLGLDSVWAEERDIICKILNNSVKALTRMHDGLEPTSFLARAPVKFFDLFSTVNRYQLGYQTEALIKAITAMVEIVGQARDSDELNTEPLKRLYGYVINGLGNIMRTLGMTPEAGKRREGAGRGAWGGMGGLGM